MTIDAMVMMVLILGLIWGGFAWVLVVAMRKHEGQAQTDDTE